MIKFWLLGYEFPTTLFVLTLDTFYIVTTGKKGKYLPYSIYLANNAEAKHLETLKGGKIPLEILVRSKDPEQNAKHFQKCLDAIKSAGVRYQTAFSLAMNQLI